MVAAVDRYAICQASKREIEPSPVVKSVCEESGRPELASRLVVDTSAFYDERNRKLGLGSSAAVAVAASVFASQKTDHESYESALNGHRKAASGVGSGIDVAASYYGGVIATTNQPAPLKHLPGEIPGLYLAVFFLNRSAKTEHMVKACQSSRDWQSITEGMAKTSLEGIEAWRAGSASDFVDASREYGRQMQALGVSANAPVFTEQMDRLSKISNTYGAAAKPSGAGGGDVALVWSTNSDDLDQIEQESSLKRIKLQISPRGVQFIDS